MIAHKIMIISGIFMCILGLIGNILNICIFTIWSRSKKSSHRHTHSNNRSVNSPLYLFASSIANLIIILYPLLTRIMFDGYQYKITQTNVFILCKLRYYFLHTFYLISLTCICMATFDRYLISSRDVHLRELSPTRHRTIIIILIICTLIGLHNIPLIIFFNLSNNGQCIIYSITYSYYYLYVFRILLQGIIPIIFLSLFGILTFRQLKILAQHSACNHINSDRQLARMLLLISITIIISTIPNCIEQIYDIIMNHTNSKPSSKFFLYHVISSILFYTNPVTSFYIFYISTPNFRTQLRNLITYKKHHDYLINHQIHSTNYNK
ncbi:unnamed protein product [Adineta steineri]|uniref:G-protein coupled receptors family 1 profile domain-containing protein n=1 Tax=Adineta steineri TaxID=433720 RepID=A0A818KUF5_9BILA|nr:unnamed protein product [Adineta steineri]CAF0817858.1 unnamed protein product [Adineta steineri]CAF0973597.1 unnamed protein product [Adineta steineri]CAF0990414.1 unnamed protein product [Adineta steineri]CAF1073473.1 unnamed protein product [Adineta steineri]